MASQNPCPLDSAVWLLWEFYIPGDGMNTVPYPITRQGDPAKTTYQNLGHSCRGVLVKATPKENLAVSTWSQDFQTGNDPFQRKLCFRPKRSVCCSSLIIAQWLGGSCLQANTF